jgi:hypothetical protein
MSGGIDRRRRGFLDDRSCTMGIDCAPLLLDGSIPKPKVISVLGRRGSRVEEKQLQQRSGHHAKTSR